VGWRFRPLYAFRTRILTTLTCTIVSSMLSIAPPRFTRRQNILQVERRREGGEEEVERRGGEKEERRRRREGEEKRRRREGRETGERMDE
jgi:hypothetical protein